MRKKLLRKVTLMALCLVFSMLSLTQLSNAATNYSSNVGIEFIQGDPEPDGETVVTPPDSQNPIPQVTQPKLPQTGEGSQWSLTLLGVACLGLVSYVLNSRKKSLKA